MLLLLLTVLAGSVALCAAQTREPSTTRRPFNEEDFFSGITRAQLPLLSELTDNVVANLQTVVQSLRELNETTAGPVLRKLSEVIQGVHPELSFKLTLKNITRVP